MMKPEALTCPNCGAPLKVAPGQSLALCLYCDTSVHIGGPESAPAEVTPETGVPSGTIREVKQLLMDGKRDAALALYREAVHGGEEEAARVLDSLAREVAMSIVMTQRLSPVGALFMLAYFALIAWSVTAGISGAISPALAILLVVVTLVLLWPFARAPWTTLRYLTAPRAEATVVRAAAIGRLKSVHAFRLLVDVRPYSGDPPFEAHMVLPVREQSLPQLQPGLRLQVRYRPGEPDSLLFDKVLQ